MRSTREFTGVRVLGGRNGTRRIGKVLRAVFHPDDYRLVGYLIARPDLLFMFKRPDRFLAYDAFRVVDGRVVATIDHDSWDSAACRRLGLDWDACLILEGMPVLAGEGEAVTAMGRVSAVDYDERTGKTLALEVVDSVASRALLGVSRIPIELIEDCRDAQLIVREEAASIATEGGLAAKAGEGVAVAGDALVKGATKVRAAAGEASKKVGKTAGEALDVGSKALGKGIGVGSRAVGKQMKRTKGMFKAFRDEYRKASK
ncbi:MAG: PRC-barrel domain containing protein [Coriobacteriales bacterium]|nr:PRC-barrel domain containing protein [Coriobacteriales bacterium]